LKRYSDLGEAGAVVADVAVALLRGLVAVRAEGGLTGVRQTMDVGVHSYDD
jgi:hypothetical protein